MSNPSLHRIFAEHPASVGENYFQHLGHAAAFGVRLVGSGLACLIHALVPAAFSQTGSDTVARLHREMVIERRNRAQQP